jgi:hypothetical protein
VLDSINLADKTYEELMAEAIEKIPTLTDEWTNFNTSDPGITMLQNLTSFTTMQREAVNDVPEPILYALLKMLGFVPGSDSAAETFLSAPGMADGLYLHPGEKLMAEDICYEADGAVTLEPWGVTGIYCETEEGLRDITYLRSGVSRTGAPIFGVPARVDSALYVFFNDIPSYRDSLRLLTRIMNEERRNEFKETDFSLAELKWQFYTHSGWVGVEAEDGTRGFLESGVIRIHLNAADKELFTLSGTTGYALRCILESEQYDNAPRLHSMTSNVFPVKQKDSRIQVDHFDGSEPVFLQNRVALSGYHMVFCDEDGSGAYYRYIPWTGLAGEEDGRYYTEDKGDNGISIKFSKERFGHAPALQPDSVRVFCCDVKSAEHLVLGKLMGYDNQVFDVDGFNRILPEEFSVMVESADADGVKVFHFVEPGDEDPHRLCYRVQSEPAQMQVISPGDMEGCLIHIATCAVTEGVRGNIRAQNIFVPRFLSEESEKTGGAASMPVIVNALDITGGADTESAEQLRLRLLADIREHSVAVTLGDYEHIVKNTPGLCIHKVKAVADPENNLVRITVKPYSETDMPSLSPLYVDNITAHLNKSRMIGTRIEIVSPIYKMIDIRVVVYAKGYFENVREKIEEYLRKEIDGVTGDMAFGSTISYNRLYKGLEALDFVDSLYDFSVAPRDWQDARPEGPDIILGDGVLSYLGELIIEIR